MRTTFPYRPHERRISPRSRAASVVRFVRSAAGSFALAVGDELEGEHRAEAAHLADLLDPGRDLVEARPDPLARAPRSARGTRSSRPRRAPRMRRRAGDRVAAERAAEPAGLRRVHHLGAAGDARPAAARRRATCPRRAGPARRRSARSPRPGRCGRRRTAPRRRRRGCRARGRAPRSRAGKSLGHRDEPALALHRLDDDARDPRARRAATRAPRVASSDGHAAVRIRPRRAVDLGRERAEALLVATPCASSSSSAASARGRRSRRRRRRASRSAARAILTAFSTASAPRVQEQALLARRPRRARARRAGGRPRRTARRSRP